MKLKLTTLFIAFFVTFSVFASEHGIYLQTITAIKGSVPEVQSQLAKIFENNGYQILSNLKISTPDYVRQDTSEHCGFSAGVLVLQNTDYTKMLVSYGSKYLVASFLRIGIYEDTSGVNVEIADPETMNRIVFNDLYDNDQEKTYNEVVDKTTKFKTGFVKLIHTLGIGTNVEKAMPPIRNDDDLAESSKDMFMMVGHLTFFTDEDQFPIIYSKENKNGFDGLLKLKEQFANNIASFVPTEDDSSYRWSPSPKDLQWKIVSAIQSPKKDAILLGLTRPRTEAVSFNIAGSSREDDTNMCPGLDHSAAYPIEVLLLQDGNKINVYTQREMSRMDMYFWDAGMSAFMDHMSMPGILDESIKKALLGKEYTED